MTVLVVNPNGSEAVTRAMVRAAAEILPQVEGATMEGLPAMLTTPEALAASAERVAQITPDAAVQGVIVAAFGDPGRAALAGRLAVPVVGIGQSAALEARATAEPFAVATTTPALRDAIDTLMAEGGPGYLGSFITEGDPEALLGDVAALDAALLRAVEQAATAGARSVIIGGGPLGDAADRLGALAPVPLIHPLRAAARRMVDLLAEARTAPLADRLIAAHRAGTRIDIGDMAPRTHPEAYAIQRRVSAAFGPVGGFKTGRQGTAPRIIAPIRADRCLPSGASLQVSATIGVELEIGFRVLRPGLASAPEAEIARYLQPVAALELVDTRLSGAAADDPLAKLADAQINWGMVVGEVASAWDGADITCAEARLTCGTDTVLAGSAPVQGGSALQSIRKALPLLLRHYGPPEPGQIILTGALHPLVWYPAGTELRGEIAGIGRVAASFV